MTLTLLVCLIQTMDDILLRVQPLAFHPTISKSELNASGKVILPQTILNKILDISNNEIPSPLIFTIIKDGEEIISVGVEEFSWCRKLYLFTPLYH